LSLIFDQKILLYLHCKVRLSKSNY